MLERKISRRTVTQGLALLPMATLLPGALRSGATQAASVASENAAQSPNVLVVVFDTLSAPHMSLHGYPRRTTPNLERFAARSTVYHAHYAAGNFTTPGTASILTGAYPWSHRAFNHAGTVAEPYADQNLFGAFAGGDYQRIAYTHNLLASSLLHQFGNHIDVHINPSELCLTNGSLADRLFPNDADMATRSFDDLLLRRGDIPGSLFLSLADRVRMKAQKELGVREYAADYPRGVQELFKLTFVLTHVIDGLRNMIDAAETPFLGYFHLLPPHEPYRPHREYIGIFDDGWQPAVKDERVFSQKISQAELNRHRLEYDEFLTYADAEFGRLLDHLERSGRLDDTIVVFTSDHGQLFERGIHGHVTQTLYDPLIHVPLLISLPGQRTRQDVYTPTSCVDLLPTLLHLTGQSIPAWCEGRVLPNFAEENGAAPGVYAVEAKQNLKHAPLQKATFTWRTEQYKLIQYTGYRSEEIYELYDLANDPAELNDIYSAKRTTAEAMRHALNAKLAQVNQTHMPG